MKGIIAKCEDNTYQGLEDIIDDNLKMLFKAIIKVDKKYYHTINPVSNSNDTIDQLERIFAYELYHQWSIILDDYYQGIPEEDRLIINGEIGKHMLDLTKYPDMVLHKGHSDTQHQEIVVEIKRKVGIKGDNLAKDIIKISNFMTEGYMGCDASPYKNGVFILTNGNENDIKDQLKFIKDGDTFNPEIYCVFCEGDNSISYITLDEF